MGAVFEEVVDPARLAAVRATQLLDTDAEEAFDRLTRMATSYTGAAFAFVTLVDEQRSYWKSVQGLPAELDGVRQNPVEESYCQHVVAARAERVVGDLRADPDFRDLPATTGLGMAAWAGFPLHGPDGEVLGTLCAMDTAPREWSAQDLGFLRSMAQSASGEIALRGALREARLASAEAQRHARAAERHAALAEQHAAEAAELAHTLQESLLPATMPTIPGMDVAAMYRAGGHGSEVLGDFYDVFPTQTGWGVVVGDVCGKGVSAARTTALARSTVRAVGHTENDAAAVLATLNDVLHVWFGSQRSFVTAAYATFRPADDTEGADRVPVTVASGGHPAGFVLRADGAVAELAAGGRILGILPDAIVAQEAITLGPGDSLVLFTDGITESRARAGGAQFGEDGVREVLTALVAGVDARSVADAVSRAALEHAAGRVPDDTAVIVLRTLPRS